MALAWIAPQPVYLPGFADHIGNIFSRKPECKSPWRPVTRFANDLLVGRMNSFSEETTYRAALLAPSHKILGPSQAIWLTAVFFAIGHFYDTPSGIAGVLATGFFGLILARSMVETKGLFWPGVIHLWADVVIFSFMAIGALQLGS